MNQKEICWALLALACVLLSACASGKMTAANYERAVERQSKEDFQRRLAY
jgi:outer membrane biogenesis lipoprotein LolB